MAKIAKVGMKTEIWHTLSKGRPRPASKYRAIFDVLNHKLQKIKWKWQHIQSGKTGQAKLSSHLSCFSMHFLHPIPSPTPLLAFPQLGPRAYIWQGSLLLPKKTELITQSHWAGVRGCGWQPHHVTDVMNDPGQIPCLPRLQLPLYKRR